MLRQKSCRWATCGSFRDRGSGKSAWACDSNTKAWIYAASAAYLATIQLTPYPVFGPVSDLDEGLDGLRRVERRIAVPGFVHAQANTLALSESYRRRYLGGDVHAVGHLLEHADFELEEWARGLAKTIRESRTISDHASDVLLDRDSQWPAASDSRNRRGVHACNGSIETAAYRRLGRKAI